MRQSNVMVVFELVLARMMTVLFEKYVMPLDLWKDILLYMAFFVAIYGIVAACYRFILKK